MLVAGFQNVKNANKSVPYGKKNPEIQYESGYPSLSHFAMNWTLSLRSIIQDASGLSDG